MMNNKFQLFLIIFLMVTNNGYAMLARVFSKYPFSHKKFRIRSFSQAHTPPLIHIAIKNDDWKKVEFLLKENKDLIHSTDAGKYSPLHYVRSLYVASMLLEYGADVNACNSLNETPLYTVPSYIVPLLLDAGARIDLSSKKTIYISEEHGYLPLTPVRKAVLLGEATKFNHYLPYISSVTEFYILYALIKMYNHELLKESPYPYWREKQRDLNSIQQGIINKISKGI